MRLFLVDYLHFLAYHRADSVLSRLKTMTNDFSILVVEQSEDARSGLYAGYIEIFSIFCRTAEDVCRNAFCSTACRFFDGLS